VSEDLFKVLLWFPLDAELTVRAMLQIRAAQLGDNYAVNVLTRDVPASSVIYSLPRYKPLINVKYSDLQDHVFINRPSSLNYNLTVRDLLTVQDYPDRPREVTVCGETNVYLRELFHCTGEGVLPFSRPGSLFKRLATSLVLSVKLLSSSRTLMFENEDININTVYFSPITCSFKVT
jgi:hypothetical protein